MNAIPPYTARIPQQPGYYWLETPDGEDIVEVWNDPGHPDPERTFFIHRCGSGEVADISSLENARWSGPIPSPHNHQPSSL